MEMKDRGIRLIKKGKKGLLSIVFSRFWIMSILIVLQFVVLFMMVFQYGEYRQHYDIVKNVFVTLMVLYVLNHPMNSNAKITWLVLVMLFPVFGALLFWFTQLELGHRMEKVRLEHIINMTKTAIPQNKELLKKVSEESAQTEALVHYLARSGCYPIYDKTEVTYFPSGEAKFEELLNQYEKTLEDITFDYENLSDEETTFACRLIYGRNTCSM